MKVSVYKASTVKQKCRTVTVTVPDFKHHVEHFLNSLLFLSGEDVPQGGFGKVKGEPSAAFTRTNQTCHNYSRLLAVFCRTISTLWLVAAIDRGVGLDFGQCVWSKVKSRLRKAEKSLRQCFLFLLESDKAVSSVRANAFVCACCLQAVAFCRKKNPNTPEQ